MELDFFLETLDQKRRKQKNPVEFSCVSSVDTPADSLKAVFLIASPQEWEQEIAQIEVQLDGKRIFHGNCDRQIVSMGQNGCRLTIWGRSDAAVLLDNEAIPQEYSRVSLNEMFCRHLEPYGFQSQFPSEVQGVLTDYRVGKGVSEWEAFCTFCQRAVKMTPYVHLLKVSFLTRGRGQHIITPQNSMVKQISKSTRRSEVISETLIRDELGRYSSQVTNEQAKELKIKRRRCLIPSAQWAQPAADARIKMEQSMRGRVRWKIELAEVLDWELGEEVVFSEYFRGNIVHREIGFSQKGGFTRLFIE